MLLERALVKVFLKKINLKYIVLCEDLSISNINTAGIPDNEMKTLILDVKFNEKYFESYLDNPILDVKIIDVLMKILIKDLN